MNKNIWIFFLCAVLVIITQFIILSPILQYRLFNITEDWPFLVYYRSFSDPFLNIINIWTHAGLHTTAQIYHIGILSNFLTFKYQDYQLVNVTLKALSTISFYPLVLIIFKDKRLAFIATILFGLSSATAGSFLWVVKGSEYIGIILMNLFFIAYYFTILKNSFKHLFLSAVLILLSYLMAPPRMFPLPLIVILSEVYWVLKTKKLSNIKYSILRASILILPIYLISKPAPVSSMPFTSRPAILLNDIKIGHLYNILDPFAGIGWTLFTNEVWKIFPTLEFSTFTNFNNYLQFLLRPIFLSSITTLILSFIITKNPRNFFIKVFVTNLFLEILMFFIINPQIINPKNVSLPSDGHFLYTKYPTIMTFYIFSVVLVCFLEWRKKKNNLLQAIWLGPIFSIVFLWPTWIIMGPLVNDWSSTHWYYSIPAMGTTLFLAAILVLLYEKLVTLHFSKYFAPLVIIVIVFVFYYGHGIAITKAYMGVNPEKIKITDQQALHEKLMYKLGSSAKKGNLLVYLDIAGDKVNLRRTPQYYREALVVTKFGYWVHFRRGDNGKINDGCIEAIIDKKILQSTVVINENQKGFSYTGICVNKKNSTYNPDKVFYNLDNFQAYRVQDGEFIDIKQEILKELGMNLQFLL